MQLDVLMEQLRHSSRMRSKKATHILQPPLDETFLGEMKAKPGQALVAAIDLRGDFGESSDHWDTAFNVPHEQQMSDLAMVSELAEAGLVHAYTNISQAGLLDTVAMFAEASSVGFIIDLKKVPKPTVVSWHRWLRCFPSYGFLLAVDQERVHAVVAKFIVRDIAAANIGVADTTDSVHVRYEQDTALFINTKRSSALKKIPIEVRGEALKSLV